MARASNEREGAPKEVLAVFGFSEGAGMEPETYILMNVTSSFVHVSGMTEK